MFSIRTFVTSLFGVAALAATAGAQVNGDWPQWRGPDRTAVSSETGLLKEWPKGGPPLLWTATGMGKGFGSLAVAGGKIYVSGGGRNGQQVSCVDLDGKVVWTAPIGRSGDSRCTPTIDGDLLYVLATQGNQQADIVCLETAGGKERWRKNFADLNGKMMTAWGYSESVLVDGDHVVCTPGGAEATLAALNKKTGDIVWKSAVPGGDAAGYASIVVAEVGGIRQYITLLEKCIVGVSAKDGKFLWRYNKVANGTANIPTPIVKGDLVFCSTGYGKGSALLKLVPAGDGIKVEEQYFLNGNTFQNHHGGMVMVGDYVYAGHGHNRGAPICVEVKTGKVVWVKHFDDEAKRGSAAVVFADGRLYFRYQNAVMSLIEATPDGFKEVGSFEIPKGATPSWSHPVVAGGRLYLRDQDRLLCYDVKAK